MENKTNNKYLIPPIDIYETEDNYIILWDIPGATKDGVEINVEKDVLTVIAHVPEIDTGWKLVDGEFKLADYRRDITIGNRVDRDKITAHYDNGVLKLELGKSEQAKPKKIQVSVA